jgi:hypothetical protein
VCIYSVAQKRNCALLVGNSSADAERVLSFSIATFVRPARKNVLWVLKTDDFEDFGKGVKNVIKIYQNFTFSKCLVK